MNCSKCNDHMFDNGVHCTGGSMMCPPLFLVREENQGEGEALEIRETDPEAAAEKWADEYDSDGDYRIVSGDTVTVVVKSEDGTETKYRVSGESVPQYHAHPI